jgi:hypothetical protein
MNAPLHQVLIQTQTAMDQDTLPLMFRPGYGIGHNPT